MNHDQNKKLMTLYKRKKHLQERVAKSGQDLSFDKAEITALQFAIDCITIADDNNLISPLTGTYHAPT
jgi:hypothetical protein